MAGRGPTRRQQQTADNAHLISLTLSFRCTVCLLPSLLALLILLRQVFLQSYTELHVMSREARLLQPWPWSQRTQHLLAHTMLTFIHRVETMS